jgi:tellurite resistance protein TerC
MPADRRSIVDVSVSWWVAASVVLVVLLAVDLALGGRQGQAPTVRQAGLWVMGYCVAAVVFAGLVFARFGPEYAGQFLAGWVTEYSLSVDNLFVFLVLLSRFSVPPSAQLRVLTFGIVLALLLRGLLIAVGVVVLARYSWVFALFGGFLLWTAGSLLRGGIDTPTGGETSRVVLLLERVIPATRTWHGTCLLTRVDGRWVLTPMLLTMTAIGATDVLFALDSIPAIFGLTTEPFLVVTANALALLGLRQLYFLVGSLLEKLPLLGTGLAVVLGFIGVKLILQALHENSLPFVNGGRPVEGVPEIPVSVSLLVVIGVLVLTTFIGLARRRDAARWSGVGGRAFLRRPVEPPEPPEPPE